MDGVRKTVFVCVDRAGWLARWSWRHRVWLAAWLLVAVLWWADGAPSTAAAMALCGVFPGLVGCGWSGRSPESYERFVASPARRMGWRFMVRRHWAEVCRKCHLSDRQVVGKVRGKNGQHTDETRWVAPRLRRVRVRGHSVQLTIQTRPGQTLTELETGAERLAATFRASTYRTLPVSGAGAASVLVVELVMLDVLTTPTTGAEPEPRALVDFVTLGRTQRGGPWRLAIRGWHTLIVGATGSGKGSILWGICCGLAPAVRVDMVRLWGIDLKRGVELSMGEGLFSARAYTPTAALDVLRALMKVIDERGARMAGTTRLHAPTVGDPLHVLVIDELAVLTAYGPVEIRREGERLLSEILTQGRALGVVVVAFVQDPRKEVVTMRTLFSQTIALRLRSSDETSMSLGDGMARSAPAHRIDKNHPGTAWVVEDTGAVDRVRADYWPDDLIRLLARRYATDVHHTIVPPSEGGGPDVPGGVDLDMDTPPARSLVTPRSPREPRKPRKPRSPRTPRAGAETDGAGVPS